jgi:hypothetical protein
MKFLGQIINKRVSAKILIGTKHLHHCSTDDGIIDATKQILFPGFYQSMNQFIWYVHDEAAKVLEKADFVQLKLPLTQHVFGPMPKPLIRFVMSRKGDLRITIEETWIYSFDEIYAII